MCGIFAIINKSEKVVPSVLKRGISSISHRGPDCEGTLIDGKVGLAHCRLSVFDTSNKGAQPMKRGGYSIIYNGAIYNFPEIRDQLKQKGYKFQSHSDTEVILYSYIEYGKECVHHFNGQWAFTIYDKLKNLIFCSRDRFGIKPIYYYIDKSGIYLSSEIKAFTCLPSWKTKLNHTRAREFFAYQMHDHTDETLFKGVKALPGGKNFLYDLNTDKYVIEEYYNLDSISVSSIDKDTAQSEVNSRLNQSIAYRLRSDVPIGLALSGGLDSSSIAVRAMKLISNPIDSFSIVYKEHGLDESPYLDVMPLEIRARNQRFSPDFDELISIVEDVLWHQEEPFNGMSVLAQYMLMSKVQDRGMKVLLDGQGADEIFAGYEKFYLIQLRNHFLRNPISGFYHLIRLSKKFPTFRLWERLRAYSNSQNTIVPPWIKIKSETNQYIRPVEESVLDISKNLFTGPGLGALLRYEDKNAMAHGIESRLPYLDHHLVEFVLSLPAEFKVAVAGTKIILRDINKDLLPQKIIKRRDKLGFVTPERRWISTNKELFKGEINHLSTELGDYVDINMAIKEYDPVVLWRLFIFGRWLRQWG